MTLRINSDYFPKRLTRLIFAIKTQCSGLLPRDHEFRIILLLSLFSAKVKQVGSPWKKKAVDFENMATAVPSWYLISDWSGVTKYSKNKK
jgi:hypothetical protein